MEIMKRRNIQPRLGSESIEEIYSDLNSIEKTIEKNDVIPSILSTASNEESPEFK